MATISVIFEQMYVGALLKHEKHWIRKNRNGVGAEQ